MKLNMKKETHATATATSAAPVLLYAITTDPFPLQASADLVNPYIATVTVMATNNSGAPVQLQGLQVTIPIGTGPTSLTNDAIDIGPVPPTPDWTASLITSAGQAQFTFAPTDPNANYIVVANNASVCFVFNAVQINAASGSALITVVEGSNNCTIGQNCPTVQLQINKFPNGWGQVAFWVNPPVIAAGGKSVLHWSGPEKGTYTIDYKTLLGGDIHVPLQGALPLSNKGRYPAANAPDLVLQDTTAFTLTVKAVIDEKPYYTQLQKIVSVLTHPPQILQFTGFFQRNTAGKLQLVLNWLTDGDYCKITGDTAVYGQKSLDNSYVITPDVTHPLRSQYVLTAMNDLGQVTSTLYVNWGSSDEYVAPGNIAGTVALGPLTGDIYTMDMNGVVNEISGRPMQPTSYQWQSGLTTLPSVIVASNDGQSVFVVSGSSNNLYYLDNHLNLINQLNASNVQGGLQPIGMTALAVSPDNSYVCTCAIDGTVCNFPLSTLSNFGGWLPALTTGSPGTTCIDISGDGEFIYTISLGNQKGTISNNVSMFKKDLTALGSALLPGYPILLRVAPDNSRLFVGMGLQYQVTPSINVYSPMSNRLPLPLTGVMPITDPTLFGMAVSKDSKSLYVVTLDKYNNYNLSIYDTQTLAIVVPGVSLGACSASPPSSDQIPITADGCTMAINGQVSTPVRIIQPTSVSGGVPAQM
jgi:hypothetical protein